MAKRPTDRERKKELIAALAQSRQSLDSRRRQLRRQLSPAVRLRRVVRNNPLPVFGIAAGSALVLTLLLHRPRNRNDEKPVSTKRIVLRWAISLAKPAVRIWLLNRAKDHFLPVKEGPWDKSPTPARRAGSPPDAAPLAPSRP